MSDTSYMDGVTLLGNQNTHYDYSYNPDVLETFNNKHPDNDYVVTFDAYEFTSLCLTGDTLIEVARDESLYPNGIPIKNLVGTSGYVFGFDYVTRKPVCNRYHDVRKTGTQAPILKITLDCVRGGNGNGHTRWHEESYLRCTPDHLVLVKTHRYTYEWIAAKDLQPGMHLVYHQCSGDTIRGLNKYRLIASEVYGIPLHEIRDNDVHHKDHNHFNNSPNNLEVKTKHDHYHDHQLERYGYDRSLNIDHLVDLYNHGMNINQLCKMFNCDYGTIKDRLKDRVRLRTQSEALKINYDKEFYQRDVEICELYQRGCTSYEIGQYMDIHPTTVLQILRKYNVSVRGANDLRKEKKENPLPPLNHKVVSIDFDGFEDVYNMEVENVHNFFANGVCVHNCPKTGQPDLAKIIISYIPDVKMVESKSLKLYLFSFRSTGEFHENCVNTIGKDLVKLMKPKYLEVRGIFAPRGGISIFPLYTYATEEYKDFEKQRMLDALRDGSNRTTRYDI